MTLVKEYLDYTKKYKSIYGEKTLVLMQVGSFFECYAIKKGEGVYEGSNILEFTQINDMIIANKNTCVDENDIVMAGFGLAQLDKYVKKMLTRGYTVVVYVQDLQSKNTTRSLACIYSPGTYFDNNDYYSLNNDENDSNNNDINSNLSNNTLCVWLHYSKANKIIKTENITIGLNVIDILTGKIVSYEYSNPYINSPTTYDQLEKYISIYNPSEVIIITNKSESIDNIISFANINASKIHKIYLEDKSKTEKSKSEKTSKNNIESFEKIAINCEKQIYQETLIDKIYGIGSYREKSEFHNYSIANQSLCFLIDFIDKHNPSLIKNISYPCFENINNKLILANHSLKQLNIISDQRYNGKLGCVVNFLNNCVTNAGKRKFNYDLLHPICDIENLNKSYNVTDHLLKTQFYKTIKEYLLNVRDIEKIERKLVLGKIDPKDFATLYSNLSNVSKLFEKISVNKENLQLYTYINSIIDCDISCYSNIINEFIYKTFDLTKLNNLMIDKLNNYNLEDLNFINSSYNSKLNKLFKNSIDAKQQFEAISHFLSSLLADYEKPKFSNVAKKTKSKTVKKIDHEISNDSDVINNPKSENNECENSLYNNVANYVKIHETSKNDAMLIVTKRRANILKDLLEKIIEKSGSNYSISYVSKYTKQTETIELDLTCIEFKNHGANNTNNIIVSSQINEISHVIQNSRDILIDGIQENYKNILCEFNNLIYKDNSNTNKDSSNISNVSLLGIISQFVALIDLCYVKAYNATKYNYCKPTIYDCDCGLREDGAKSYVNFKKIRHCLIEHLNNNELYVTNDLAIGSLNNGMLLYGTNAVGKTSFIKSIGIAIIMAQAGMYVPCEEFTYYPYEYLFTRILGNDNIFKGLSTFAVEMCELRTILKNATPNSIILGDELCSGTESTSALSIFVSSLERLHSLESTFLFATHFHEILDYDEVKNLDSLKTYHMSVLFDKEQNTLIYDRKLREGPGESMYGLEVCKSLALPDDFIERAYAIRNKYNKPKNNVMEAKKTRYNSKKIRGKCELCNLNDGTEIHHLQFQKNASPQGIINGEFSKNHKANLINICESCHQKIHNNEQEFRINKTSKGYQLCEI